MKSPDEEKCVYSSDYQIQFIHVCCTLYVQRVVCGQSRYTRNELLLRCAAAGSYKDAAAAAEADK